MEKLDGVNFDELKELLIRRHGEKAGPAILAIDGRCASGKSTLGERLSREWDADLFHMDDFYLQPHQRTEEWLSEPGGNVDRERFLEEVLLPLSRGEAVSYRRFDCGTFAFEPLRLIRPGAIAVVEGSYSCHPELREFYDMRVFLDIDPKTQRERILQRNGPEVLQRFIDRWIPLEENYFSGCAVRDCCDWIIRNDK